MARLAAAAMVVALACVAAAEPTGRFLRTPEDVTTRVGTTIVLHCSIEAVIGDVQWTRDGLGLGTGRGQLLGWDRYRIVGSDKQRKHNLRSPRTCPMVRHANRFRTLIGVRCF